LKRCLKTCYSPGGEDPRAFSQGVAVKRLRCIVALWFALFTALSMASPLFNPTSLDSVCSPEHGARLLVVNDQGESTDAKLTTGDCPLCSGFFTPDLLSQQRFEAPSPLAHALEPQQEAFLIALALPPLPSRGPPTQF
jgi:hypothetical protein